jgi:hypothetical protein
MRNMKPLWQIAPTYRYAAFFFGAIALFLFGVVGAMIRQEYQVAVNPRVMGHIERTWTIVRGRHHQLVRVADFAFTVTHAGEQMKCQVEGKDIGDADFDVKAGDSIELSPIPGSCATPYVINIQPPGWVLGAMTAFVAAAGFLFALMAWGALSNSDSRLGSWIHNWLRRYGIYAAY